ncbi:hypothetical protein CCHR01_09970 [Colletotrichum chrysophilum]|uniref:Uncharacterized protein n=1 Tax=Colletotrichum chrysophilum TaxID=1836956 RepID=A0AAD9AIK0_9PEZI|nr:hypothetical protein CCHR01_09970 [Colletotrichum chrysophilum]
MVSATIQDGTSHPDSPRLHSHRSRKAETASPSTKQRSPTKCSNGAARPDDPGERLHKTN